MDRAEHSTRDLRRRIYEILERGSPGDRLSLAIDRGIVALIIVNLVAVALESVPDLQARYSRVFALIEVLSLVVFTVEYALRLWVAVEHAPYHHLSPAARRLRYAVSAAGIIDLLAVLPFWFALLLPADLRVVLVFRMVRFLKIARYLVGDALAARRALQRAPRAVRLHRDHGWRHPDRRHADAPGRGPGAARQVRHHSRGDVVGLSSRSAPSAMATSCR